MPLAKTPAPPYYAVIFTSVLSEDSADYEEMAEKLVEGCSTQPGFLGLDSARSAIGITVCYWDSLESISKWKENEVHQYAQKTGKEKWYTAYQVRIAKVEKVYGDDS